MVTNNGGTPPCEKCGVEEDHKVSVWSEERQMFLNFHKCVEGTLNDYVIPIHLIQHLQTQQAQLEQMAGALIGAVRAKGLKTPDGFVMTILKRFLAPAQVNVQMNNSNGDYIVTVRELVDESQKGVIRV